MAKSVLLPFCKPIFATIQETAAVGLAINGHPTAYNGILNQCVSLGCSRKFLRGLTSSPIVYIPLLNISAFEFIDKFSNTGRFGVSNYRDDVKRMLDEGYYVLFTNVDDFYVPGKSWYGVRHMPHDGIICGYDDNDETFSIASYDSNWVFNLFRTPQSCFVEGANACYENKQYGEITAYKIKPNTTVKLDMDMILKKLKRHLECTVETIPLDRGHVVEGAVVYDLLAMYIDKLKDESIPPDKMDWRAFRPVWEHKCAMLDRIKAIEAEKGWDSKLSLSYVPLVSQANYIRGMYAMYHKNRKVGLLDQIRKSLIELRQRECDILQDLVRKMEGAS